jgi:hypothetical protein
MATASQSPSTLRSEEGRAGSDPAWAGPASAGVEPRLAFRTALGRYKGARLAAIRLAQGFYPDGARIRPAGTAEEITDHLDQPAAIEGIVARLPLGSCLALSLFAVTETSRMSLAGVTHALGILGAEPDGAVVRLLELGLVAIEPDAQLGPVDDFPAALRRVNPARLQLRVHPAVPRAVRPMPPEGKLPAVAGPVARVFESDGLEPILRLGAVWQRAGIEPLRQTQQGTLYKRDHERITGDPVLTGPIADAMERLPDSAGLWLALAHRIGLVEPDQSAQRLLGASPDFWADNALHLPQMIATGWLALRTWDEVRGAASEPAASSLAVPYLRPAALLWLATLGDGEWVALDDLAGHLSSRRPGWDRLSLTDDPDRDAAKPVSLAATRGRASESSSSRRGTARRERTRAGTEPAPRGASVLESLLFGAAYPLGLIRAAEERGSRRRVIQLTPLGRYVLALGPTPPPLPTFDRFLFVQPNFEVIAYRQGLTPQLVGGLSRFAWWSRIGAALELKLTRESIIHGLEGGLTAESILDTLTRHSQRPLPPGVVDAIQTWTSRRERVTYHPAATLIEFGSPSDRDQALASWPEGDHEPPIAVADRFLLVEAERTIPFDRFRLTSARDYRRPPELCVTVAADGVSLVLDPARSDLLVEAEVSRFADELPPAGLARQPSSEPEPRRLVVTAASLRRGLSRGLSPAQLAEWFARRTGREVPPAVRLLLAAQSTRVPPLTATRMMVLTLPSAEFLDGLLQHPATRPWLGDRLGPTSVVILEEQLAPLQQALKDLGFPLDVVGLDIPLQRIGST